MTPEELTRRVLIEHWRGVYGKLHPLIGSRLWEPICLVCESPLHRQGEVWSCSSSGCALQGKPAPADLGIEAVRKVIDADEVLQARLVDGHRTSQREAFTRVGRRITAVIGGNRGGKSVGAASTVLAFAYGGVHALAPGHAKTITAAYLIGAHATPWHAVLLGVVVTVSHTWSIYALALVTHVFWID